MKFEILGQPPREGKRWQIGKDTALELEKHNRLEIIDGIVKKAIYPEDELDKRKFEPFWSHLTAKEVGSALNGKDILNEIMGESIGFDTVKTPMLIQKLLSYFDSNSIILDSFAGSGTTAHAVLNMNKIDNGNRKFILVEMEDYAESITAERVKRVIDGYVFTGKKETELYSKKLTINNIENCSEFLNEAKQIINDNEAEFDKISKPKLKDNCIKVIATKNYKDKIDGLGGSFTFYDLGDRFLLEDGNLNPSVSIDKIREYIFFTETKCVLEQAKDDEPHYLGTHVDTAYYFNFETDKSTILNRGYLSNVKTSAQQYVIYADTCTLSSTELEKYHITFKKIPRDITKL